MAVPAHQAVCRRLATALLATLVLLVPSVAAAAPGPTAVPASGAAPDSYAGPCTDDLGVTVVVDFQQLGGATVVRCAPGSNGQPFQGSGLQAFQAAGIQIAGTSQHGLSVVCRVNGRPAADEELPIPGDEHYTEQCVKMPPAAAFWSYWQADNGGSWTFSQLGVTGSTARAGGFEALSFSLNSTSAPPRTAPSRPAPEPSPPPPPEPTDPPEQPEPGPSEPAPSKPAPPSPTPTDPAPSDPAPNPEPSDPAPSDPDPGEPRPTDPGSGDPAPSDPEPTAPEVTDPADPPADPGTTPSADDPSGTDQGTSAEGTDTESASTDAETSTDTEDATATSTPEDGAAQAAPDPAEDSADPSAQVAGAQVASEPTDQGGAGALWVTFGILLVLGGLAFLISRRRRDPGITHQVEP